MTDTPSPYLDWVSYVVGAILTFRKQIEVALGLAGGTHSLDDVLNRLIRGDAWLVRSEHAFVIFEVHDFPQAKHLHLWLGGALPGYRDELLNDLVSKAPDLALSHGCSAVTVAGRGGWERLAPEHGFETHSTILRKGVGHDQIH